MDTIFSEANMLIILRLTITVMCTYLTLIIMTRLLTWVIRNARIISEYYTSASNDGVAITAMQMWEYVISSRTTSVQIKKTFFNIGSAEIERMILIHAKKCHKDWMKAKATYSEKFDWEFVPEWMEKHLQWNSDSVLYIKSEALDNGVH